MPEWKALQADYRYLNRDPDPLVTPVMIHWECTETDGDDVGRAYGADSIGEDQPQFAESQMRRVTEAIMLDWLHTHMGAEWVAAQEQVAADALQQAMEPDYGSTPPDNP